MGICRIIFADKQKRKKILRGYIGQYLQHIRREAGLSGTEMGRRLGVSQQQLSRYECGRSGMDIIMFLHYCWHLDVSPADCLNKVFTNIKDSFQ